MQTHGLAGDFGFRVCFRERDSESGEEAEDNDRGTHFELVEVGRKLEMGYLKLRQGRTKSATESSIIIEDTVKTPTICGFRLDARARK